MISRRLRAALLALPLAALVACGGPTGAAPTSDPAAAEEDGATGAEDGADAEADDAGTGTDDAASGADAGEGGGGGTSGSGGDCASAAADLTPEGAAASFPDNPDAVWSVTGESTDDAGRAVVEVVPEGDDVGYPAFRFVFRCDGDMPVHVGTYASEDGAWVLLFTTDELGSEELTPTLP